MLNNNTRVTIRYRNATNLLPLNSACWTYLHWTGMMLCQMTLGYAKQLLNSLLKCISTSRGKRKRLEYEDPFKDLSTLASQKSKSGSFLIKVLGWENSKCMKIHKENKRISFLKNKTKQTHCSSPGYEQGSLVLSSQTLLHIFPQPRPRHTSAHW